MNTLYKPGNSFFHRCDSRVKLALIPVFGVAVFLFFNPIIPFALLVVSVLINLTATGKYTFQNSLTKILLLLFLFSVVIHGFVNPNGKTPALFLGVPLCLPYFGFYTLEGFYFGLTFGLRVSCIAMIGLLYVSTTHPTEVVNGLTKLGVPYQFGFMLLMSMQLIPISTREVKIIMSAQRARGLVERTLWDKIKGLAPLFIPLVISSLERMETLSMSLESRAYGSSEHPTELYEVHFSKKDACILTAGILLLTVSIIFRIHFGNLNWMYSLANWKSVFKPTIG